MDFGGVANVVHKSFPNKFPDCKVIGPNACFWWMLLNCCGCFKRMQVLKTMCDKGTVFKNDKSRLILGIEYARPLSESVKALVEAYIEHKKI